MRGRTRTGTKTRSRTRTLTNSKATFLRRTSMRKRKRTKGRSGTRGAGGPNITRTATIRSHFTVILPYSVYKITIEKMKTYKKSSLYYYNDFYLCITNDTCLFYTYLLEQNRL